MSIRPGTYDAAMTNEPSPGVRLKNHRPRGREARSGGCMVATGIPEAVIGLYLAAVGCGVKGLPAGEFREPLWIPVAFGLVFLVSGVAMISCGVARRRRAARLLDVARRHPDEPWLADHDWNERGAGDEGLPELLRAWDLAVVLPSVLVPIQLRLAGAPGGHPLAWIVLALFDAGALVALGYALYLLARLLKFGRSTLAFHRFPFFLGDVFEADFRTSANIAMVNRLVFTLRCIQEVIDSKPGDTGLSLACFEVHREEHVVERPGTTTRISFPLPADPRLATRLGPLPPRTWELEVTGEAPGVDFAAQFLVPVYAPRAAGVHGRLCSRLATPGSDGPGKRTL